MKIDVCICTFKRDAISDAMMSVDQQVLPENIQLRLIVIDNDVEPSAKGRVTATAERMRVPVTYVHAPAHNISIARNAGLDAVADDTDWIAIMDDDELASPNWIANLVGHAITNNCDVVFGPAIARYPEGTPDWITDLDYLSSYPESRGGEYQTGPTNNTLMRATSPFIKGRRFRLEKGRTGGEDTAFFFEVWHAGGKLDMCETAIVYEDVDPKRLNFHWLKQRKYRSGMSYGRSSLNSKSILKRFFLAITAAIKTAFCVVCAAGTFWSPSRRNFWALRSIFHSGVMTAFLRDEPELY